MVVRYDKKYFADSVKSGNNQLKANQPINQSIVRIERVLKLINQLNAALHSFLNGSHSINYEGGEPDSVISRVNPPVIGNNVHTDTCTVRCTASRMILKL